MRILGYLTLKQYRILSGEMTSMAGRGANAKSCPVMLQKLLLNGFVEDVALASGRWLWKVTERGRSEARISLHEANRLERLEERKRGVNSIAACIFIAAILGGFGPLIVR